MWAGRLLEVLEGYLEIMDHIVHIVYVTYYITDPKLHMWHLVQKHSELREIE